MANDIRPINIAAGTYDESCQRTFDEDFCHYLATGWVYSGNDAFIMGKPITKRYAGFVLDPKFIYKQDEWDCWFVSLAAGGLNRFQEVAPFKLPYICWHRRSDSKMKFWEWNKFFKKTKQEKNNG